MSEPKAVKEKVYIPQMVSYRFPSGAPLSAKTEIPAAAAAALQRCCVRERESVRRSLISPVYLTVSGAVLKKKTSSEKKFDSYQLLDNAILCQSS